MVGLQGLSATANLLQQLSSREAPAVSRPDSVFSSALILKDEFLKGVSAEKMVGSATFNAMASLSEKRAEALGEVLQHIDTVKAASETGDILSPSASKPIEGALSQQTELAAKLRQYVLDHPSAVLDMLDDIKAGRPDLSKQQAMTLLMEQIGQKISAASSMEATASELADA